MSNFFRALAIGVLPSVLRLIASTIETYIEKTCSEEGGENE